MSKKEIIQANNLLEKRKVCQILYSFCQKGEILLILDKMMAR